MLKKIGTGILVLIALWVGLQVFRGILLSTGKDESTEEINESADELQRAIDKSRESP